MRLPIVALIRLYQIVVSPLFPPSCRFHPTCSQYALVAVSEHGVLRGSWLALARLARCHPWNPGGVDYVPGPRNSSAKGTHSCT
ncbi:MAG TPA: membrane protein insertion efficiency factor YidD [Candidatus Cybelea sp.]|nr:membrane protein insertion efficiency factor YidD [Candidatus Cybelea sp.]